MAYLKNAWYLAAWSSEVAENILSRTYLDIPVMLYRSEAGDVVALHDRCPHRFAPLSKGAVIDGAVRCGYHGLTFDAQGNCIKNLFSPVAPRAAKVRAFPVIERHNAIWIWMGEPAAADPAAIPSLPHHTDQTMRCLYGLTHARADYRLLSDNLMDLTHTALLHPLFGGMHYIPKCKTWEDGDAIVAQFLIDRMPDFLNATEGFVHNEDQIQWTAPATHILHSRVTPEGGEVIYIPSAHILTPETATSTHYFWSSAFAADTPVSDEDMRAVLVQAFDIEDKPMVEAVQARMNNADLWDLDPVLLPQDAAAVRVRRRLAELIAAESTPA